VRAEADPAASDATETTIASDIKNLLRPEPIKSTFNNPQLICNPRSEI